MLGKPHILSLFQTRLINSIKHEHSCKILYVHTNFHPVNQQHSIYLHVLSIGVENSVNPDQMALLEAS